MKAQDDVAAGPKREDEEEEGEEPYNEENIEQVGPEGHQSAGMVDFISTMNVVIFVVPSETKCATEEAHGSLRSP